MEGGKSRPARFQSNRRLPGPIVNPAESRMVCVQHPEAGILRVELRQWIGPAIASACLFLGACVESDDPTATATTDASVHSGDTSQPPAVATSLPGQFQQPTMAGAAGGQATSKRYQVVFSLGGAIPPMVSESWRVNNPPQPVAQ